MRFPHIHTNLKIGVVRGSLNQRRSSISSPVGWDTSHGRSTVPPRRPDTSTTGTEGKKQGVIERDGSRGKKEREKGEAVAELG